MLTTNPRASARLTLALAIALTTCSGAAAAGRAYGQTPGAVEHVKHHRASAAQLPPPLPTFVPLEPSTPEEGLRR